MIYIIYTSIDTNAENCTYTDKQVDEAGAIRTYLSVRLNDHWLKNTRCPSGKHRSTR